MNQIYIVTGATGFLGRTVCARLVELGSEVRVLVRPGTSEANVAAGVKIYEGNVLSPESIKCLFEPASVSPSRAKRLSSDSMEGLFEPTGCLPPGAERLSQESICTMFNDGSISGGKAACRECQDRACEPVPDMESAAKGARDELASGEDEASEPEYIFIHAAGVISVNKKDRECYETNLRGTENVIAACRAHNVRRLIYISSVDALHDPGDGRPVPEPDNFDAPCPDTAYAKSKREASRLVFEANSPTLETLVLVPAPIIGPGDYKGGFVSTMLEMYVRGLPPFSITGGYDFVDVRDVAEAVIQATRADITGNVIQPPAEKNTTAGVIHACRTDMTEDRIQDIAEKNNTAGVIHACRTDMAESMIQPPARGTANGVIHATAKPGAGKIYVLSGHYVTVTQLLDTLAAQLGRHRTVKTFPAQILYPVIPFMMLVYKLRKKHAPLSFSALKLLINGSGFSHERAERELGYTVRPFEESVRDTVEFIKNKRP